MATTIDENGNIIETILPDPYVKTYSIDQLAIELEEAKLRQAGAIAEVQALQQKYDDLVAQINQINNP